MNSTETILEMKNISKQFNSKNESILALKNINITIKQGEFIIILGPSGSGKTTFLYCLTGLMKPSEGKIIHKGTEIQNLSFNQKAELRKFEFGMIYQFFNLYPELTAKENIELPMMISKLFSENERQSRSLELLNLVGMSQRANNIPYELSGGEKQRISFARALANNPSIILADEPTGNVDSEIAQELLEVLLRFWKEMNKTIILVTHDINLIKPEMRFIRMKDGSIVNDLVVTTSFVEEFKKDPLMNS